MMMPSRLWSTRAAKAVAKTDAVKVTMTAEAGRLLKRHAMTLDGGVLRKRGTQSGSDLAAGSGGLRAIIHPEEQEALAVALYDRGRRYAALRVEFHDDGPAISPLDLPEDVIANLFGPELDVLKLAEAIPDCAYIKAQYVQATDAASPRESDPCYGSLPRDDCSSAAVAAELRSLYIKRLSLVPEDMAGRAASEFLRTSTTTLTVMKMEAAMGRGVGGTFDPTRDAIALPNRVFQPLWDRIKHSRLPPEAADIVEHSAAALVHELRHARQFHELGFDDPGFSEGESLAYVDQALFLWGRIERDPDYEGMGTFNRILLSTAGFPAPIKQWWKEPLKTADLDRLRRFTPSAKALMGDRLTDNTANNWFFARSLAGGLAGMDANLGRFAEGLSAFEIPDDFFSQRKEAASQGIAKMQACLSLENEPGVRRRFEEYIHALKERMYLYSEPSRFRRLLEYYRRERAAQQAEIERRIKL